MLGLSRPFDYQLGYRMTAPQPRKYMYLWFRLLPVRSPLLGESRLISSPRGTEMFHFPRFATQRYVFTLS